MADAYIEQENYEEALEILQAGQEQTESEAFSSKLEEVEELLTESEKTEESLASTEDIATEDGNPQRPACGARHNLHMNDLRNMASAVTGCAVANLKMTDEFSMRWRCYDHVMTLEKLREDILG